MNAELQTTLSLATHGNALFRGAPCSCAFGPQSASPLRLAGDFIADGEATLSHPRAWLESLQTRGARRLWINVFAGESQTSRWGLEVELGEFSEVWVARGAGSGFDFVRLISQVPSTLRTPRLDEAHHQLNVALSEAQREAIEARDAELAASLLEARDCLDGTGPHPTDHILPDQGYGTQPRLIFHAAQRVAAISMEQVKQGALLQQAVLAAVLAAANSPL